MRPIAATPGPEAADKWVFGHPSRGSERADLGRLVGRQFPSGVVDAPPALIAEPPADRSVATPTSTESCFG